MGGVISGRYSMTAQVYTESIVQQESGSIMREWDYENFDKIDCMVQPIQSRGMRNVGSTEQWGRQYLDVDWIRVSTKNKLSKSMRLGNIKVKRNGSLLFPDVIFDVLGVTPIPDPFGQIIEYEILAAEAPSK